MRGTVRQALETRKARFRAALALARLTAKEWTEREGLTETHLYAFLKGHRQSKPLEQKIDAFIDKYLPEPTAQAL